MKRILRFLGDPRLWVFIVLMIGLYLGQWERNNAAMVFVFIVVVFTFVRVENLVKSINSNIDELKTKLDDLRN